MSNSRNLSRTIRLDGTTTLHHGADAKLATTSTGVTITGDTSATNSTLTGYLRGPTSFVIDPAAHGDDTGTVVIAGNLQVDGLTTTINSTTLTVDDLNIVLASGAADSSSANGAGITIDGANASLTYSHSGTKFVLNKPLDVTGNIGVTGEIDASILLKVGVNNTEYANNYIRFKSAGAAYIDHSTTGQDINFRTSASSSLDTTPFVIKSGGNVGIGTALPTALLDVKKDVDSFIMKVENDGNSPGTSGNAYADASDGLWVDTRWNTATNTPFKVTSNSGTAPMMIIKGNGDVGIGTDAPGCALDITRTSGWAEVHLDGAAGGDLILKDDGVNYGEIYAGSGHGMVLKSYASQHMIFLTNADATAKMTIQSGGNVGIGTDSPDGKFVVSNSGAEGIEFFPASTSNQNTTQHYNRSGSAYVKNRTIALNHEWVNGSTDPAMNLIPDGDSTFLLIKAKHLSPNQSANITLYGTNIGVYGGSAVCRATIQAVTDGSAFGTKLQMYTNGGLGAQTNVENNHLTINSGGQIEGSITGKSITLNTNDWTTFGRLYGAQSTPLHFSIVSGHNSSGWYGEFTNDTYAYNIAVGTAISLGTNASSNSQYGGGSYSVSVRKIKRVGGDYSTGDGGWEYQIARDQGYGTLAQINMMGATASWTWLI
jgi:hypothetical protein